MRVSESLVGPDSRIYITLVSWVSRLEMLISTPAKDTLLSPRLAVHV